MGTVIRFPEERRRMFVGAEAALGRPEAPSIVILPVIRIERHADDAAFPGPDAGAPSGGRRRGPGRRS